EAQWQDFFERQQWVFGYGLDYRMMRQFDREMTVGKGGTDNRNKPVIDFLILLDHKFRRWLGDIGRMQHWHRCRVGAIATANKRWMVAIEFGTWRWGRIGGAAGSITAGNGRFFDCSGTIRSRGGNPLPLGDQKPVSCNRHRAVMVEASPGAPLIMTQADFLLEFLI